MLRIPWLLVALPLSLSAQAPSALPSERDLLTYFNAKNDADRAQFLRTLVRGPDAPATAFELEKREKEARAKLANVENGRNDQDFSSSAHTDGSTTLASAAGIVDAISAAVENGAFTQTTSGTVSTVRIKPIAVYDAFGNRNLLPCHQYLVLVQENDGCSSLPEQALKGLSFSVSLDSSRDNTVDAQPQSAVDSTGMSTTVSVANGSVLRFLTQRRAVSSWSVRYELYNKRDARNPAYVKAWRDALTSSSLKMAGEA
jgi:hypothetical protein